MGDENREDHRYHDFSMIVRFWFVENRGFVISLGMVLKLF